MHVRGILQFVCLVACGVYGEVTLKKGINETVVFHGDQLIIMVDNSLGEGELLHLFFGSSTEKTYPPCPAGFTRITYTVADNQKLQLTVDRQGQVASNGNDVPNLAPIKFIKDGVVNIMVSKLPNGKTVVTLPNAEIYVPEEPTEDETTKKNSHAATTNLLIIVVVLIIVAFIIVIIGVIVWCCLFRKARRTQMTNLQEVPPQQNVSHKSSKPKKPSSRNPSTSKTTTTTISRLPVSPKRPIKPTVTASIPKTQLSFTTKSKRVSKSNAVANNQKSNNSASSQEA